MYKRQTKTEAQKKAEELKNESGKPESKNLTLSQSQAVNIAESIYNVLKFSSLDDDKPEAIRLLKTAQNNDDFLLIQQAFGERREYFFGLPTGGLKSLSAFMSDNFSTSQKAELKNDFLTKGIKTIF